MNGINLLSAIEQTHVSGGRSLRAEVDNRSDGVFPRLLQLLFQGTDENMSLLWESVKGEEESLADLPDEWRQLVLEWLSLLNVPVNSYIAEGDVASRQAMSDASSLSQVPNVELLSGYRLINSNETNKVGASLQGQRDVSVRMNEWWHGLSPEERQFLLRIIPRLVTGSIGDPIENAPALLLRYTSLQMPDGQWPVNRVLTEPPTTRSALAANPTPVGDLGPQRQPGEVGIPLFRPFAPPLETQPMKGWQPLHGGQAPPGNGELVEGAAWHAKSAEGKGRLLSVGDTEGTEAVFPRSSSGEQATVTSFTDSKLLPLHRPTTLHQLLFQTLPRYVVRHLHVQPDGVSHTRLSLYPEQLGQVDVHIRSHAGVVTAQLVAETWMAKEILESQLEQLRQMLQYQGVEVDELSVSVGEGRSYSRRDREPYPPFSGHGKRKEKPVQVDGLASYADSETSRIEQWRNPHASVNYTV